MNIYDLAPWRAAAEAELVYTDRRGPRRNSGIVVHCFGGWSWTTPDGAEYRTDAEGAGLWIKTQRGWQQIRGASQFALSRDRQMALRQLRRADLMPAVVEAD